MDAGDLGDIIHLGRVSDIADSGSEHKSKSVHKHLGLPSQTIPGGHLSCTRTSMFLGDTNNALIVGFSHFFFLAAVVIGPAKRTLISAETLVSNASS